MRTILSFLILPTTLYASPQLFPTTGPYQVLGTLNKDGIVILEESMKQEKILFQTKTETETKTPSKVWACILLKEPCSDGCKIVQFKVLKKAFPWERQIPKSGSYSDGQKCRID